MKTTVDFATRVARLLMALLCVGISACSHGTVVRFCTEPAMFCDDGCYDLQTSNTHCGACGNSCGVREACIEGACAAVICDAGLSPCGPDCVDLSTDIQNCGGCANACPLGDMCSAGECLPVCPTFYANCDGIPPGIVSENPGFDYCANLQNDRANCGECDNACESGFVCSAGACAITCRSDFLPCTDSEGEFCANPQRDDLNCGSCGNVCESGLHCTMGECV